MLPHAEAPLTVGLWQMCCFASCPDPPTHHPPHPLTCWPTGTIQKAQSVAICSSLRPGESKIGKVNELFVYDNFSRVGADAVEAGDICALTGIQDVMIGDTICSRDAVVALPTIKVRLRGCAELDGRVEGEGVQGRGRGACGEAQLLAGTHMILWFMQGCAPYFEPHKLQTLLNP